MTKRQINLLFILVCNLSCFLAAGAFICKMVPFVQSTAIVTEILTMTCIAVERHQGLVHPFKMKWQYTNRRAFTMLGEDVPLAVLMLFFITEQRMSSTRTMFIN